MYILVIQTLNIQLSRGVDLNSKQWAGSSFKAFLIAQARDRAFRFYAIRMFDSGNTFANSCSKFSRFPRAPFVKSETLPLLGINAGQSSVSHQFPRRGRGQSKQPVPIIVRQSVSVMACTCACVWKPRTNGYDGRCRLVISGLGNDGPKLSNGLNGH